MTTAWKRRRKSDLYRLRGHRGRLEVILSSDQADGVFGTHNGRRQLAACHSITSSARASKFGGTSRPSAFAGLRLSTNSNLVGCMTGRSAGLAPLRILPT